MDWIDLLDRYGVSTTLAAALLWFLWRIVRWLGPRVDAMFVRHLDLVDNIQDSITRIEGHVGRQARAVERLAGDHDLHSQQLERIAILLAPKHDPS